jgi:hypothetical protein
MIYIFVGYAEFYGALGLSVNSICLCMFVSLWVCAHRLKGFHALEVSIMGYHSLTSFPFAEKQHNPPCAAKLAH